MLDKLDIMHQREIPAVYAGGGGVSSCTDQTSPPPQPQKSNG